jgi:hypothetical protein
MKQTIKILTVLTIFISCISATKKTNNATEKVDYGQMIEEYLKTKAIEPTLVIENLDKNELDLLKHKINWRELDKGIEITIDGQTITTSGKVTSNAVWDSGIDSVNFANYLQQVILYEPESLIGFVLTYTPCTGLGCGVNYQIIYDLKTGKQTYFGRFRTGFEFQLYNFNSDDRPDYLSKTFYGRNAQGIDTTEYVLYSQTKNGDFEEFKTDKQERFWFKHIYTEFQTDLNNEGFEEKWIEKINKNGR